MEDKEFKKLVLEGFSKLNTRFDNIEGKVDNLEGKFDIIEGKVDNIEGKFDNMQVSLDKLTEEFLDFKNVTEKEFETTRELINQAFIKISENMSYHDTIKEMEKVLLTTRPRQRIKLKEYA